MMPLVEDVARFADAVDHSDRAEALLACRPDMLSKYAFTLSNRCHVCGFKDGADYIAEALEWLRSPYAFAKPMPMRLQAMRGRLQRISMGLPADGQDG